MKTRNTLIALAAAASVVTGLSAPAFAHDYRGRHDGWRHSSYGTGYSRYGNPFNERIQGMRYTIRQNRETGRLDWHAAESLTYRLDAISDTKRRYEWSGGGLNDQETWDLNRRLDEMSDMIRYELGGYSRW